MGQRIPLMRTSSPGGASAGALLGKTFSSGDSPRLRRSTTHTASPGSWPRTATALTKANRALMGPFSPSFIRYLRHAPGGNRAASSSTRIGRGACGATRSREGGRPFPFHAATSVGGRFSQTRVEIATSAR